MQPKKQAADWGKVRCSNGEDDASTDITRYPDVVDGCMMVALEG